MSGEITARRRRPPSLYALGIVVVVTLAGMGLFVWGPSNPFVEIENATDVSGVSADWFSQWLLPGRSLGMSQSVGADGRADTPLEVTNHSFTTVRLTDVHLEAIETDVDRDATEPTVEHVKGIPATLERSEPTMVDITVDARAWCAAHPGERFDYRLIIGARTSWGISRTLGRNGHLSLNCTQNLLPPAGDAPAHEAQARGAVTSAFVTAYDASAPAADRRASIDDDQGLEAVVATAQTGSYASALDDLRVGVTEVVFTAPDTAAVLYDLVGDHTAYATGRVGHARLVDGRWKVTRATVCADLALARVVCPPG